MPKFDVDGIQQQNTTTDSSIRYEQETKATVGTGSPNLKIGIKIWKSSLGLRYLDFSCTMQIVGSGFNINHMNPPFFGTMIQITKGPLLPMPEH